MVNQWHNFKIEKILSDEEMQSLWDLYRKSRHEPIHQFYNLFNLDRYNPKSEDIRANSGIQRLDSYAAKRGLKLYSHYFLKYVPYSFTRLHEDNNKIVEKTIITFLESSDDLVGGDTLVMDRHYELPNDENTTRKGPNNHRGNIVPVVAPSQNGNSLVYNHDVLHGVSQVRQGHRIVLVSWYVKNS